LDDEFEESSFESEFYDESEESSFSPGSDTSSYDSLPFDDVYGQTNIDSEEDEDFDIKGFRLPKRDENYYYRDDGLSANDCAWIDRYHKSFIAVHSLYVSVTMKACTTISSWLQMPNLADRNMQRARYKYIMMTFMLLNHLMTTQLVFAESIFQMAAIRRNHRFKAEKKTANKTNHQ
jgi:hypothetical protein